MVHFGSTQMNAGEKLVYHYAMLAGKRAPGLGQSQLDLFAKAAHVKKAFNSNLTSCAQTFDNVSQDQITATEHVVKEKYLKLFPNPSNDVIFVEAPSDFLNAGIEIYDINGRILLSSNIESTLEKIDISHFNNGLFFVKIRKNDRVEVGRFVKN
jgi:type 1 fimbria pilin